MYNWLRSMYCALSAASLRLIFVILVVFTILASLIIPTNLAQAGPAGGGPEATATSTGS